MDLPLLVRTLLPALVPLLQAYLEWSRATPRSLAEREERLKALCRSLCAVVLAEDARADELSVRPGPCGCGGRFRSRGQRPRTLVTTLGEVTYRRRYYTCEACSAHVLPVDEVWGVEGGSLSPSAKAQAVDLASALPFREAAVWLLRLGGMGVSLSTLWRVTQAAGAEQVAVWEAHRQATATRKGAAQWLGRSRQAGAPGRWAIGVDGLMLRIERQWREVKVAVVAPVSGTGRWVRGRMTYTASVEEAEVFRHQIVWHAHARGVTRQTVLSILSDGAAWIGALATRHFPQAVVIRDFWHVVEYLWGAAQAVHGEGTPAAKEQAGRWAKRLKAGKAGVIRRHLAWLRTRSAIQGGAAGVSLQKTESYLEHHQEAMAYGAYRAAHWPIGSGPVEAACKMIQVRMKRCGSNWSRQGAQHMLFLRAEYCSRLYASLYPQS